MKKLLLFFVILASFSAKAVAQEKQAANSASLVAAPTWFIELPGRQIEGASYERVNGYALGFDFARRIEGRWQFKLGFRHSRWQSVTKSGFLMWPSEYSTGVYVYDPTLPHYLETKATEKAWQILAGVRWSGKQKVVRPYVDFEFGMMDFARIDNRIYPTVGVGCGIEWKPSAHFGVFAQPGARFVFGYDEFGYEFLPFHLEMGGRYHF